MHCRPGRRLGSRLHPLTHVWCDYLLCEYLAGEPVNGDIEENVGVAWADRSQLAKFIPLARVFGSNRSAGEGDAMPSIAHEAIVALFQHRPALAVELLNAGFGVTVPDHARACLESGALSEIGPVEFRADAVVVLRDGEDRDGIPVMAVIVEVQRRRDAGKRWSWPMYVSALRARLKCAVVLLVVCPSSTVAGWCAEPIALGHPGFVLQPLVTGPDAIPIVDDASRARADPELAVLSALAHPVGKVIDALAEGLDALEPDIALLYAGYVLELLPIAAKKHLEDLMTTQPFTYSSEFTDRYVEKGRAEGHAEGRAAAEAESVLRVLDARGISVPDPVRDRVRSCTDSDQLAEWLRRAATADTAEDLFTEPR